MEMSISCFLFYSTRNLHTNLSLIEFCINQYLTISGYKSVVSIPISLTLSLSLLPTLPHAIFLLGECIWVGDNLWSHAIVFVYCPIFFPYSISNSISLVYLLFTVSKTCSCTSAFLIRHFSLVLNLILLFLLCLSFLLSLLSTKRFLFPFASGIPLFFCNSPPWLPVFCHMYWRPDKSFHALLPPHFKHFLSFAFPLPSPSSQFVLFEAPWYYCIVFHALWVCELITKAI